MSPLFCSYLSILVHSPWLTPRLVLLSKIVLYLGVCFQESSHPLEQYLNLFIPDARPDQQNCTGQVPEA